MAEKKLYVSKRSGWRIVLSPKGKKYDEKLKQAIYVKGEYIQFENGKYATADPKEQEILEKYINSGLCWPIAQETEALALALEKAKAEIRKKYGVEVDAKIKTPKGQPAPKAQTGSQGVAS